MSPLANPIGDIKPHYDVVVVGSGYGGGVAASRLARAGCTVCVLERGREFRAGDFGNTLWHLFNEVQLTGRWVRRGSPAGLFDFRIGKEMHVLTGCGLGGGSLINSAVALRPDHTVFQREGWPANLSSDGLLATGFERAERMLGINIFPGADGLAKFHALKRGAAALGAGVEAVPTAINYRAGTNRANVVQYGCKLCGDCWSGCNVGAKNTIALTYLPDAQHFGAEIFTLANVRYISKSHDQWVVHFEDTEPRPGASRRRRKYIVSAEIVVLAGGALGSTEILLRSRQKGLALSRRLGKGLSANGDEMVVGLDLDHPVNAVAVGHPPRAETSPVGPNCVGMIRFVDAEGRAILIQDGAMLPAMATVAPLMELTQMRWMRAARLLVQGAYGAVQSRTQVYYVVTHDDAAGEMTLLRDRLLVSWPKAEEQPLYERIKEATTALIEKLGGTYQQNPMSQRIMGNRKITAHPLGGCSMGSDASRGVVDDRCRVFDPSNPSVQGVHEGLYVCDGAVVPTSLGINPLLTITAIAERAMILLAGEKGWHFDDELARDAPLRDASM